MMLVRLTTAWLLILIATPPSSGAAPVARLNGWNTAAPFCYRVGGLRTWPIVDGKLGKNDALSLVAKHNGKTVGQGKQFQAMGLNVSVSKNGKLRVKSSGTRDQPKLSLTIQFKRSNKLIASQTVVLRAAPPDRPISYVADLVDDLIRIFWHAGSGTFQETTKGGFDQYCRRLQAQGVTRLIVWQSPFPLTIDPKGIPKLDWTRYKRQSEAIINSAELTEGMAGTKLSSWKWMRMLMRERLSSKFGQMMSQSAVEHGIKLSASFRPFEPALTKYYEVPTFDQNGKYLWGFLPAAWPAVNYQTDQVGFANFRTILNKMKRVKEAAPASIQFTGVLNAKQISQGAKAGAGLRIVASHFPPIASKSLVLIRDRQKRFSLKRYAAIAKQALGQQVELTGYTVTVENDNVRISNLRVPNGYRFIIIKRKSDSGEMIAVPLGKPIVVRSHMGNRLGRVNAYRCLDESDPDGHLTRIAGITSDGEFRTTFQAIENSLGKLGFAAKAKRLQRTSLVVDLGQDWSVEMLDFQRPKARKLAIDQLKMQLAFPAFDEVFINTRSHIQLAASTADQYEGKGPLQPLENYRLRGKEYRHLGLDKAFAPISLARNRRIAAAASDRKTVEQITNWQDDEWLAPCQSANSPFIWRYERNLAVAAGLRLLFQDLEREFPQTRIRAVIPPRAKVERAMRRGLATMKKPKGGVYGSLYYRHMWGSLNYIPSIGEGMAMVDLSGLRIEPVFLGIRYLPDPGPLDLYIREWLQDMKLNLGSKFRGPRSFFYEAQETMRANDRKVTRKRREQIIKKLLSHRADINEILLYEAADWTYYLTLDNPHGYLDPPR